MKKIIILFLLTFAYFNNYPRIGFTALSNSPSINLSNLPPLELLEDAALKKAGLDTVLIHRWQKNVRRAVALPRIQIGYDQDAEIQSTNVIQDSISVTSTGVSIGPASNRLDQDLGQNRGFEVKAIWALDELLFNANELDVSREARDLMLVRNRLLEELHRVYYDLKAQLLRLQLEPELTQDPFEKLKTDQLSDRLNSLTGGAITQLFVPEKFLNFHPMKKGGEKP